MNAKRLTSRELLWEALRKHGTSADLARRTGMSVRSVNRLLADWRRCGIAGRNTRWAGPHSYSFIHHRAHGLAYRSLDEAHRYVQERRHT